MKKEFCFIVFLMSLLCSTANGQNPYQSIGKPMPKGKMLTLSDGKFQEFFPNDTLVPIGSVMYNTVTGQVVAFLTRDTMYAEYNLEPEVVSRWLSPDPLAAKHPENSPYVYVANRPIIYVDPDGQDYVLVINHNTETITIKATYYVKRGDVDAKKSADAAVAFWNSQSEKYKYKVGKGSAAIDYEVNFNLTVEEVSEPQEQANKDRSNFGSDPSLALTNTYGVLPDADKKFENGEEGKSTNGVTTGGSLINIKDSRKSEDTGAHEVGHTLGLGHYFKGILTASSNDPNRSLNITTSYIEDLIKHGLKGKGEEDAGKVYLDQRGTAPLMFEKGKVEEVKK
jgi:RHS repeat-associated protein